MTAIFTHSPTILGAKNSVEKQFHSEEQRQNYKNSVFA